MKKLGGKITIIALALFCLTPTLWFVNHPGKIIDGVDTNYPLDPVIWLLRRFYVWNNLLNGGVDFSASIAGIFFHFWQFLFYQLGFSLVQVELLTLIFWFSLICLSAFFLARTLFKNKPLVQILFVTFYAYNIYLFNTWENVKVTNLSLMTSLPLGLTVLILLFRGKIDFFRATILTFITGILLSGSGINPAYFLTFFLITTLYVLSEILNDWNLTKLKKITVLYPSFILIIIFINSFWILPTAHYILKAIPSSGSLEKIGFTNWVNSLSENTSTMNVFRMQGAWDWYSINSNNNLPLFIPYANKYFNSYFFIIFSFLIPGLAILSLIFNKKTQKSFYIFFSLLMVFGIFLGIGTHSPTGKFFEYLSNHLPFFSLFRSPWYIFTPMVILSYSGLISLFFYNCSFLNPLSFNTKFVKSALIAILIIGNLIYCYPLILGKIFRPNDPAGFYINFPPYVFESKKWLASNIEGRVLTYPDDQIEKFKWGYRGVESILQLISDKEFLYPSLNNQDNPINLVTNDYYSALKKEELSSVINLSRILNVSYIFNRRDAETNSIALPMSFTNFAHKSFGYWDFYQLPINTNLSKFSFPSETYLYSIIKSPRYLEVLSKKDILLSQDDSKVSQLPIVNPANLVLARNSQVDNYYSYVLGSLKYSTHFNQKDFSKVNFFLDIPFDNNYKLILERYKLEDFGLNLSLPISVEIDNSKYSLLIDSVNDSYVYFKSLFLNKGTHKISFNLTEKNLVQNWPPSGGEYMLSSSNNLEDKVSLGIQDFDPLSLYLFQFKYLRVNGPEASYSLRQRTGPINVKVQTEDLVYSPEWNWYYTYFDPVKTKSDLSVELIAPIDRQGAKTLGNKVYFNNLILSKVFTNDLLAVSETKDVVSNLVNFVDIKSTPVEYEVKVSNSSQSQFVVFNESYSPDWNLEIYDLTGKKLKVNQFHFSANLYQNGWLLSSVPNQYIIKVYYGPQRLFQVGVGLMMLTLVVVGLLTFYLRKLYKR